MTLCYEGEVYISEHGCYISDLESVRIYWQLCSSSMHKHNCSLTEGTGSTTGPLSLICLLLYSNVGKKNLKGYPHAALSASRLNVSSFNVA